MRYWHQWWDDHIPCIFSRDRAKKNYDFLLEVIGHDWFEKALPSPGYSNHPLLRKWRNVSCGSFLKLNCLAEDLRLLVDRPGIDTIVMDLRSASSCEGATHTLHTAALFERAHPSAVIEFFEADHGRVPDYALQISGTDIAVEAKLLHRSDLEQTFYDFGKKVADELMLRNDPERGIHPIVYGIFRDVKQLPPVRKIVKDIRDVIYSGKSTTVERKRYKLLTKTEPPTPHDCDSIKGVYLLCPRHEDENLRVRRRGKLASRQLRAVASKHKSGIFCLGVGEIHDPIEIKMVFQNQFERGRFSGISGAMLNRMVAHDDKPSRTIIDLVQTIPNPESSHPLHQSLMFESIGEEVHMIHQRPPTDVLPAYRFVEVLAGRKGGPPSFLVPDIKRLNVGSIDW